MFQNSLVSALLMISAIGGLVLYVVWLGWRNRRKSNQINRYEYEKEKSEAHKRFYELDRDERIRLLAEELKRRGDDLSKKE